MIRKFRICKIYKIYTETILSFIQNICSINQIDLSTSTFLHLINFFKFKQHSL